MENFSTLAVAHQEENLSMKSFSAPQKNRVLDRDGDLC